MELFPLNNIYTYNLNMNSTAHVDEIEKGAAEFENAMRETGI